LAATKLAVVRGLLPEGKLILNADDPELVRQGEALERSGRPLVWFTLEAQNPVLRRHLEAGRDACWLDGEELVCALEGRREAVAALAEVPAAFGGAARHNVANALAAVALAAA